MLDELAAAVATGAAGNIIAYMLSGRVDALRAQVTRIFRHGTEHEQATVMRALDVQLGQVRLLPAWWRACLPVGACARVRACKPGRYSRGCGSCTEPGVR